MIRSACFGLVLALAALLVIGGVGPASAQKLVGTWTGTVSQNTGSSGYEVVMTVAGERIKTDYPALGCGGDLKQVGAASGYVFYFETISHGGIEQGGDCINGTVTMTQVSDSRILWGWVGGYYGEIYVAWGTLERQ